MAQHGTFAGGIIRKLIKGPEADRKPIGQLVGRVTSLQRITEVGQYSEAQFSVLMASEQMAGFSELTAHSGPVRIEFWPVQPEAVVWAATPDPRVFEVSDAHQAMAAAMDDYRDDDDE